MALGAHGEFDATALVLIIIVFVGVMMVTGDVSSWSENIFIWGPAALFMIPIAILDMVAASPLALILLPLGVVAFWYYFNFLTATLTEVFMGLVMVGTIIVLLGA